MKESNISFSSTVSSTKDTSKGGGALQLDPSLFSPSNSFSQKNSTGNAQKYVKVEQEDKEAENDTMDVEMEVTDDEADEDEDTFKPPQVKLVCFCCQVCYVVKSE